MQARANPGCLDHDSFVELRGVIEHDPSEVLEALDRGDARILGRLSAGTVQDLIAAVHAGLRPRRGFRSKVVVLKDAAEVDALARALGRAAKSKFPPVRHDAWSMPITFEGFPLRPGDNHAIVDVMDSIAPPQGKR